MSALLNFITEQDQDTLYAIRKDAICNQTDHDLCHNDIFLQEWMAEKSRWLSKPFTQGLILKKEVEYQADEDELLNKLNSLYYEANDLRQKITSLTREDNYSILVCYLFEIRNLLTNKIRTDAPLKFYFNDNDFIEIHNGEKTSKVITKICKTLDIADLWEPLRIKHSQILNTKTLTGKLCVSIHPLDYLTASVNDCGWSSCMNIVNEGDYCRGVVEMMNSPRVVVAYLESAEPMRDYHWNSKKWREFFIVDPQDGIISIKGYPYCNIYLEKEVCTWLSELYPFDDYEELHYGNVFMDHSIDITCGPAMYNDFNSNERYYRVTKSNCYRTIDYSGRASCLACGTTSVDWRSVATDSVVCPSCGGYLICDNCGDYVPQNEAYYNDGNVYCSNCYFDNFFCCANCEEDHPSDEDNDVTVITKDKDGEYHILTEHYHLCNQCYNMYFRDQPSFRGKLNNRWGSVYYDLHIYPDHFNGPNSELDFFLEHGTPYYDATFKSLELN